jgi:hypothetical protein
MVDDGVTGSLHYFTIYGDFSCGHPYSYPTVTQFYCRDPAAYFGFRTIPVVPAQYSYTSTHQINFAVPAQNLVGLPQNVPPYPAESPTGPGNCDAWVSSRNQTSRFYIQLNT